MDQAELDVLIIGAGPAGMTLAAALHRQGVRLRVIDKDDGPTDLTRAPVLWQRTQELLDAMGLRDMWLPEADEMREESLHFYGKAAGELPVTAVSSPFPKALYAGQNVTERLLDRHLSEAGCKVDYRTEAVFYQEEADGACVTTRNADGLEELVRARWVVSAEGSKSVVRHAVGLDYEGEKYIGFRIHIADVNASWTLATPVGQTFFYVEKYGYMGGQRLPGHPDRFYFYILTKDEHPDDNSNELDIKEVERLVRQFSGDQEATLSEPNWLNTARYRHGLADTYRKGRAMLIGDTARSAPPLYGQGMNYAMHDAWNLAWKLAHVVKGWGPEALLDTFATERRKLGAELDARIDSTFRFVTEPKTLQATLIGAVMPTLLLSDRFKHSFGQQFSEMDLNYAGVGLHETASSLGDLKAAWRTPALWVKRLPDCTLANLLDLFDGTAWTLLVIAPAEQDNKKAQALIDFARSKQASFPRTLRPVLLSQGPKRPATLPFQTVVDAEGRFVREHGLPDTGLLLVRPDGYIAWAAKSGTEELDAYLNHWLR